jgi:phosphoribosyl-AMP cyclohydrolase
VFLDYKIFVKDKELDPLDFSEVFIDQSICVLQDFKTAKVLDVLIANQETLELTLKTGKVHFFDKTKNTIQVAGILDNQFFLIKEVFINPESNKILYKVEAETSLTVFFEKNTELITSSSNNSPLETFLEKQTEAKNQTKLEIYEEFSNISQSLILQQLEPNLNLSVKKLKIREITLCLLKSITKILKKEKIDFKDIF